MVNIKFSHTVLDTSAVATLRYFYKLPVTSAVISAHSLPWITGGDFRSYAFRTSVNYPCPCYTGIHKNLIKLMTTESNELQIPLLPNKERVQHTIINMLLDHNPKLAQFHLFIICEPRTCGCAVRGLLIINSPQFRLLQCVLYMPYKWSESNKTANEIVL